MKEKWPEFGLEGYPWTVTKGQAGRWEAWMLEDWKIRAKSSGIEVSG